MTRQDQENREIGNREQGTGVHRETWQTGGME